MVFITYGTQPHDFKYLGTVINEIDQQYQVAAQIGESNNNIIRPNTEVYTYMDNFADYTANCDILITHGGVGSIMDGLKQHKKVIVIPRLAKYGEHVDDHQLEITTKFANDGYIYYMHRDEHINQVLNKVQTINFKSYESNTKNFVNKFEKLLRGEKND